MTNKNTRRGFTQSCFPKGFTLIELLVVVLIIGILAAVAVPQYQKAVWRSRNVQLRHYVNVIARAEQAYFLANGTYAVNFNELNIDLPLHSQTTTPGNTVAPCAVRVEGTNSVLKGENFQVILYRKDGNISVSARYIEGKYKCSGFSSNSSRSFNELRCLEREGWTNGAPGDFCVKLERGTLIRQGDQQNSTSYSLP